MASIDPVRSRREATLSADARIAELQAELHDAERALADLEARDALKTQFLSNISHDLRTPLSALITHAEVLRDGMLGSVNDRQRESIVAVIGAGHQLLAMINEILGYARGAGGHLT